MGRKNASDIVDDVDRYFIPLENRICDRCSEGEPVLLIVYGDEGHQFICNKCMHDEEKVAHEGSIQMLQESYDS